MQSILNYNILYSLSIVLFWVISAYDCCCLVSFIGSCWNISGSGVALPAVSEVPDNNVASTSRLPVAFKYWEDINIRQIFINALIN